MVLVKTLEFGGNWYKAMFAAIIITDVLFLFSSCNCAKNIAGLMFDVGRKVEVSFDREDFQDAWFPAAIREDLGNQTFLVEYNSVNPDSHGSTKASVDSLHIRPCPPLLKDKNFILLEKVDAFFDFGWWNGIITKELESSRYLVFFKQMKCEKEFNQSELRPHMDWKDGKWFTSAQVLSTLLKKLSLIGYTIYFLFVVFE